ncbi:MAG: DNA-3-methyladenine glycosylase 2 [Halothiobacillus sp.]
MNTQITHQEPLPEHFHPDAILAFYQRDTQQLAERVEAGKLHKGLFWRGMPSSISIEFKHPLATAQLQLDGEIAPQDAHQLKQLTRHLLGLNQPIAAFEQAHHAHPELGALIARQTGLRVPVTPTPFEALSSAIIGQQISLNAAVTVRREFIKIAGILHRSGLWCAPDAARIAGCTPAMLRKAGLSLNKANALIVASQAIMHGDLTLFAGADTPLTPQKIDDIRHQLLAIKGIGPWTVNYTLLRGFGWLDGALHGDAGVRRSLQTLLGREEPIAPAETERWLAEFSPWRALVAAHLWAALGNPPN